MGVKLFILEPVAFLLIYGLTMGIGSVPNPARFTPLVLNTVRETVQYIGNRHALSIGFDAINLITVGLQWLNHFLGQHPELSSIMSMNIKGVRIKGTSPERLKKWFMDLGIALTEYRISPKNLYNMDESRFAIGDIGASKVIINANIR